MTADTAAPTTTLTHGRTTYTVEYLGADEEVAYRLTGPRGASYTAMRNNHDRSMLFVVNLRSFGSTVPFEWVRETAPGVIEVTR